MIIINRLKELRITNKLNMRELAKKLNLPYTTYVNYEKQQREPSLETLIKIATFYGVTVDYLIGKSDNKYPPPTIADNFVTFPVIGEIAAGYDSIALENWSGDTINIPEDYLNGRNKNDFFVLQVKGDSMYPTYQEGDRVLILKTSTLEYCGQVGVILYDGEYASLKKVEYVPGEEWLRMVAINPQVPPKTVEGADLEHCKIIGIPKLLIRAIKA